jgi:hypothetical protein
MSEDKGKNPLEDYDSWEFDQIYTKNELIIKLKKIVGDLEKGKLKVEVNEAKKSPSIPLDTNIPSDDFFCTFEYEVEPMFADENAKKGYFGIKLFWSDLGIEKLIEEEEMLEDLEDEEDYDSEEDYNDDKEE